MQSYLRASMIFHRHHFQISRMVTDYRVHIRTLFSAWEITVLKTCVLVISVQITQPGQVLNSVHGVQLSKASMHGVSQQDRVPTKDSSYRNSLHPFPHEKLPHSKFFSNKTWTFHPGKYRPAHSPPPPAPGKYIPVWQLSIRAHCLLVNTVFATFCAY